MVSIVEPLKIAHWMSEIALREIALCGAGSQRYFY